MQFIVSPAVPTLRVEGGGRGVLEPIPAIISYSKGEVVPWECSQFITGPHRQTTTYRQIWTLNLYHVYVYIYMYLIIDFFFIVVVEISCKRQKLGKHTDSTQ